MLKIAFDVECPSLGRTVRVREITLAELRVTLAGEERAPDLPGVVAVSGVLFFGYVAPEMFARMSFEDRARVLSVACRLNPGLFDAPDETPDANAAAETALTVAQLERAVARLIAAGHPDAWDYPWSVFNAAADVLFEDAKAENI
jgi:hypothetical protein